MCSNHAFWALYCGGNLLENNQKAVDASAVKLSKGYLKIIDVFNTNIDK